MDINETNLNLLVHFKTLMSELNVSRSAERAKLTQPAMSHILSELRRVFEDPLLVRGQNGLTPTNRAMELSKQIFPILNKLDTALINQSPFDPKTSKRTFVISTNDYLSLMIMPKLLSRLNKLAPHVRIEVEAISKTSIEDLSRRRADLVVAYHIKKKMELPYHEKVMFNDKYVLLVNKNHSTIKDNVTVTELSKLDLIIISRQGGGLGRLAKRLEENGMKPSIGFLHPHFMVSAFVVAESDMVYLVSEREAKLVADLPVKTVEVPLDMATDDIKLYWHDVSDTDLGAKWLRDQFYAVTKSW